MTNVDKNSACLTLQNQQSETDKLFVFFIEYIKQQDIPDSIQDDFRLALEETFINIISYAYCDEQAHDIHVEISHSCNADTGTINIAFIDTGRAFNPLTDADKFCADDEHCDGGMGIHLIKSLTDAQVYKRTKQTNVFTLTKHYTH